VSIRRKLLLWMLLVFLVVFGAIGITTTRAVRHELTARLDRTMIDAVQGAVTASAVLTPEQSSAFAQQAPSETAWLVVGEEGVRGGQSAQDEEGVVPDADLSDHQLDDLLDHAGEPFTVSSADGSRQLRAVAAPFGDRQALVMVRSMSSIDETVSNLTRTFVLIAAAALLVSVVAVAIVGRLAVRPVEEMIDLAHAIGEGELSRRATPGDRSTEVGRLAEALNAMLERLERAFHDKDVSERQMREFLSDASHELRNPVTSVRAHAEMIRNPAFAQEDALAYASRIEAEAVRMGRLVDDLLLLARLDQGSELDASDVDVVALVADAVDGASVVDPSASITLEAPDLPITVRADAHRLRQAIDNLMTNARVHGGADASVVVRVARVDDHAIVSVSDDGPGVDADELARLSDRFYRAECARRQGRPGRGLGLSLVWGVVAGHHGALALASDDRGFVATVRLPLG
jgi:two-component system OmpR family sensor kinase